MGEWDSTYAATAQLAATAYNAASAANTNKKQREWSEKMYDIQRANALTDWHMQNDYNSPAAAMKRFEAAGLNKNLIYGNSNQNGPVVRSTDAGSYNPQAPQLDLRGAAQSFLSSTDLELRQAQTDNIKANNKNILLDSILKAGQIQQLGVQTSLTEQNLKQMQNLATSTIEQAALNVEKTKQDIQFTANQDKRNESLTQQNLLEGVERIANLKSSNQFTNAQIQNAKQQLTNLKQDSRIKELDAKLADQNIRAGSPIHDKILNYILSPGDAHQRVKNILNTFDKWLPDFLKVNAK